MVKENIRKLVAKICICPYEGHTTSFDVIRIKQAIQKQK